MRLYFSTNMKIIFIIAFLVVQSCQSVSIFDLQMMMEGVNATTCHLKTKDELTFPADSLAHPPTYQDGADVDPSPNQALLTEAANMALNRAIFYSFINQKLNATSDFEKQPDLIYEYLSVVSSLTASRDGIVGAGIYYDSNTSYPNWYKSLQFNKTVSLFAPYAMHNYMKDGIVVEDDSIRNYTKSSSKTNGWYHRWLPDIGSIIPKESYDLNFEGNTSSSFSFYALNNIYLNYQQRVRFTAPYFDCGRSNKWIVTATAPVTDFMPRYSVWQHLRRPRFVAVSTVDVDFTKLDINQCPLSADNPSPNMFADSHFCSSLQVCVPVSGLGFKSGGYNCTCRKGYNYQDHNYKTPYRGVDIENARALYLLNGGFGCVRDGTPVIGKREADVPNMKDNGELTKIQNRANSECASSSLKTVSNVLPYSRRLTEHFEPQARQALRLSQFLSSYLQNSFNPSQNSTLKQTHALNQDQILAEATAILLSDLQVLSVFVFINVGQPSEGSDFLRALVTKEVTSAGGFGPFEFDLKSVPVSDPLLENEYRLNVNKSVVGLQSQTVDVLVKSSPYDAKKLTQMPSWTYEVPANESGVWSAPIYRCGIKQWYLTYTLPVVSFNKDVEFRGQVDLSVIVPASLLIEN